MFQEVLNSALSMKETTDDRASANIRNVQVKQQRAYKHRHQWNIDDKVPLQSQKRLRRKGEEYT